MLKARGWIFRGGPIAGAFLFLAASLRGASTASLPAADPPGAVSLSQNESAFILSNGLITARIQKSSGDLVSLLYKGLELMAQHRGGADGGYWSSVGRGRPGSHHAAVVRIDPSTNGGARAEISCQLGNDPQSPTAPLDADYRYAL